MQSDLYFAGNTGLVVATMTISAKTFGKGTMVGPLVSNLGTANRGPAPEEIFRPLA
jgi:hypothetical protein